MPFLGSHDIIGNVLREDVDDILGKCFAARSCNGFCIALEQLRKSGLESVIGGKIQVGAGGFGGHWEGRVGGEVYEEPITISVHCTDIGYSCQYAGHRDRWGRTPHGIDDGVSAMRRGPEWGRTPHGVDDGRRSVIRLPLLAELG